MPVCQGPANPDQVHDRENLRALVPVLRGRHRVAEEPAHVGMSALDERRRARCNEAVDLALLEQAGNGRALWRIVEPHACRQLHRDLLRTPGLLDAAAYPVDVGRLHPEIIFQDGARPDIGGELIFRHADLAALEICRRLDAVGAHIERGVAERLRHERRNAHVRAFAERRLQRVARQRQFADVEINRAEGTEEDLLRR